jgi:23S rRNA pseudouridine2605 synthase
MENKKRGQFSKERERSNPEKRSSKPSHSSNKPSGRKPSSTDKPYNKEKSSDYDKKRSSATGRGRSSERSEDKPSGYRREARPDAGDQRYSKPRTAVAGRGRSSERSEDKPSGYRREARPDAGDQRYSKPRTAVAGRGRSSERSEEKPSSFRRESKADQNDSRPSGYRKERVSGSGKGKSFERSDEKPSGYRRDSRQDSADYKPSRFRKEKSSYDKPEARKARPVKADLNAPLRLNKFIANAGVCSRREADKLIESGAVKVNGVIVTELGTKVIPSDKVQLGDQTLSSEKLRYVLLNKPKSYITTTDDPFRRNTVMSLIDGACRERIYPVGRLDRNTTGLLLFTNDGELAKRLTHPRFGVRKIYDVELDKPLTKRDMESIAAGVELDGETIIIDEIAYVEFDKNKKHVGIELHSGQNRVVRRIFESFGYEVLKLDRMMIGSLTKKELPRGKWRHLKEIEIRMLKRL